MLELWRASRRVRTLFVGGGGFIFPRWTEAFFPDNPRIDVAEIDPADYDVAAAVAFLASDDARPITGVDWLLDGGQTLQSWANAPNADAYPIRSARPGAPSE